MKKEARNQKKKAAELKRRYGPLAASMVAYYHHLDLRPLEELDDDAFAYIMVNVKGVNMLDLNGTEIGNESIRLLPELEYVKELRIKECRQVNNDCIPYLNGIRGLEFLHAKSTGITIDGLLGLHELDGLKTLMFSDDELAVTKEKLLRLRSVLPGCEFVINAKTVYFDDEENG